MIIILNFIIWKKYLSLVRELKDGIFVGPKMRSLIKDGKVENLLSEIAKLTWIATKNCYKNHFENYKISN